MKRLALLVAVLLAATCLVACAPAEDVLYGVLDEVFGTESYYAEDFVAEDPGWDDDVDPIAVYAVDDDLDLAPVETDGGTSNPDFADPARHEEIWALIVSVLPNDVLRDEVCRFVIFGDGKDGDLAYVEPMPADPEQWQFAVDIQDARGLSDEEYMSTLIHEFGHLVTLGASQVPPDTTRPAETWDQEWVEPSPVEEACTTFYTGEGCANPDSYINVFFELFWDDVYDEHLRGANATESQEEYDDFALRFYDRYPDRFVNDYAATNPGEDIAESFAYFVMEDMPDGASMADQKLLFFYEFDELVEIRADIRDSLE